jgi:hypothetical protein
MPHQTPITPAANRYSRHCQRTKLKRLSPVQVTWGSCAASPSCLVGAAGQKTELLIAATEDFIVKTSAGLRTWPQKAQDTGSAQQLKRPIKPEQLLKLPAQAAGTRRASLSEPLVMAFPAAAEYRPCSAVSRDGVASVACKQE